LEINPERRPTAHQALALATAPQPPRQPPRQNTKKPPPTKEEIRDLRPPAKTRATGDKPRRRVGALVGVGLTVAIGLLVWHSVKQEYFTLTRDDAAQYLGASPNTVTETELAGPPNGKRMAHHYRWAPIGDPSRAVDYTIAVKDSADTAGQQIHPLSGRSAIQLPHGSNAAIVPFSNGFGNGPGCELQLQNDDIFIQVDLRGGTSSANDCADAQDAAYTIDNRLSQFP
jgi:hypothetical protein